MAVKEKVGDYEYGRHKSSTAAATRKSGDGMIRQGLQGANPAFYPPIPFTVEAQILSTAELFTRV